MKTLKHLLLLVLACSVMRGQNAPSQPILEASAAQVTAGTVGLPYVITPRRAATGGGTGTVTHTAGALTLGLVMVGNGTADSKVVNITPTPLATGFSIAGGTTSKTLTVSNTLTLAAGADSITETMPGASFSTARIDAGQTFTGVSNTTSWAETTPVIGGASATGSNNFDLSAGSGLFKTTTGANTLSGATTINDATTPSLTLATGKTNTGFVLINGKTSGGLKLLPVDAAAQTVTISLAAQTVGAATITMPNTASVADTFAYLTLAQTLASKTLTLPVISGGLTATGAVANDFSGSSGTFKTSTGAVTIGTGAIGLTGAVTFTGPTATTALTLTQTARTSGVLPYIKWTIPTDTSLTASTEAPGLLTVTGTRQWATGALALQRENLFVGPTIAFVGASTLSDGFTVGITPVIQGTNATITRPHSLGILDSNAATSSITGAEIIATTFGTASTSIGLGGGSVVVGSNLFASTSTGRIGYLTATGAGGAVTQLTGRTTGVTINTPTGQITLFTTTGSITPSTFTVTNSSVAATDTIIINESSGTNLYEFFVTAVAAGSFNITDFTTGGTSSDTPVINYTVIKGASS